MKTVLAAIAGLALLSGPVLAQTATTPPASGTAPSTGAAASATPPADMKFVQEQANNQWLADDLIGTSVYGPGDKSIGEIDDLLLTEDGKITAAVVGVGGFLGIGEKKVAIGFESIHKSRAANGDVRLTVSATADQLKAAPEFKALKDTRSSARTTTNTATGTTASTTTTTTTRPTTTTTTTAPATGSQTASTQPAAVNISTDDQNKLKQWVAQEKRTSVAVPAGTTVAVGSVLPQNVTVYEIPASAGLPTLTRYRYAVIDNKTVLIDPADRKIVYVVS